MFSIISKGSFNKTEQFLRSRSKLDIRSILHSYGIEGVAALSAATPVETSLTAFSWAYEVVKNKTGYALIFTNSDIETGFPVAVMIQYGYGTGTGGFVEGNDYINPAIRPILDELADKVWKAVTSA